MKFFLPLVFIFGFGVAVVAEDVRFYLGTYTDNPLSQGIYTGTLDTQTGKLSPLALAAKATSPNFLALSPDEKFLYAVTQTGGGSVAAFRVGADGLLTKLNEVSADKGACHLAVDASGRNVLVANYSAGSVECFKIDEDGSVGLRTASLPFTGSGPNLQRQSHPFLHSIYLDTSNRFAYAGDLGTDHVWLFGFDPVAGKLTLMNDASGAMPPGSGTRHLAISPAGNFLYANGEMGLNVAAFARNATNGALTVLQTVSALPGEPSTNGLTTAEIFCHPTGRWLYVSIRDVTNEGRDRIAVLAVGRDGSLRWIQSFPTPVKVPRGFGLDPTGRWLLVGGQQDNKIAVLKIDSTTGKLSTTDQTADVGVPVCVVFAAVGEKMSRPWFFLKPI